MSEELLSDFESHEVETTKELVRCSTGPVTTGNLRRMIMLLLRGHYSNPENYGDDYAHLSCYKWTGGKDSTLHVGFTGLPKDDSPDNYPGVYVEFGGVQYEKMVLGNRGGISADYSGTYLSKDATLTLNVMHYAKEAGDAYDLADMSAMVLTAMGEPMALQSGARWLEVMGYDKPKLEVPSPDKYYAVAMPVKISYTLRVTRSVESHRIRRIATLVDSIN